MSSLKKLILLLILISAVSIDNTQAQSTCEVSFKRGFYANFYSEIIQSKKQVQNLNLPRIETLLTRRYLKNLKKLSTEFQSLNKKIRNSEISSNQEIQRLKDIKCEILTSPIDIYDSLSVDYAELYSSQINQCKDLAVEEIFFKILDGSIDPRLGEACLIVNLAPCVINKVLDESLKFCTN